MIDTLENGPYDYGGYTAAAAGTTTTTTTTVVDQ